MSVDVRKTYVAAVPLPVRRALRDGAVIAGLLFFAYLFVIVAPVARTVGFDAFAYWNVNPADPYAVPVGGLGAFNYSPPIAWLFGPFGSLEWPSFLWLWLALLFGRVKAPLLLDHNALARSSVNMNTKVTLSDPSTFYARALDRLLLQAKLKYEIRVDEAEKPFLWLTTLRQ
jgi:hypothetical protein